MERPRGDGATKTVSGRTSVTVPIPKKQAAFFRFALRFPLIGRSSVRGLTGVVVAATPGRVQSFSASVSGRSGRPISRWVLHHGGQRVVARTYQRDGEFPAWKHVGPGQGCPECSPSFLLETRAVPRMLHQRQECAFEMFNTDRWESVSKAPKRFDEVAGKTRCAPAWRIWGKTSRMPPRQRILAHHLHGSRCS